MKYAYFPGCVGKDSCLELDVSTKMVCKELGLEIIEMVDSTCCGAGFVQDVDYDLSLVLNARTFALAERMGLDVMTVCSTCQYNLGRANLELRQDPEKLAMVNRHLAKIGMRYNGTVDVRHLLWILVEEVGVEALRARVTRDLGELNVGAFYGCQILRPSSIHGHDSADKPEYFEKVIEAVGGKPVDYQGRKQCCGFPITFVNEKASFTMNANNMIEAKSKGADLIATSCPLCHINLDMYQRPTERVAGQRIELPILHLPQLIGLAMGMDPKSLGMKRHVVSTKSIAERVKPMRVARASPA